MQPPSQSEEFTRTPITTCIQGICMHWIHTWLMSSTACESSIMLLTVKKCI